MWCKPYNFNLMIFASMYCVLLEQILGITLESCTYTHVNTFFGDSFEVGLIV